jgi:1,2-dihydroxy-3-keto-5-methylthiopentene dioxygenase
VFEQLMTRLTIYADDNPQEILLDLNEGVAIADCLAKVGIRFERWPADRPLDPQASQSEILTAYAREVEQLMATEGYCAVDAISLEPDHPQREQLRQKFLNEHTHSEDEVRFFVAGQGLFYLHLNRQVFALLCCKNDLIRVPAGTQHWFDMGSQPCFIALRFFNNPEGWVAQFTGSDIASHFPLLP